MRHIIYCLALRGSDTIILFAKLISNHALVLILHLWSHWQQGGVLGWAGGLMLLFVYFPKVPIIKDKPGNECL